MFSSNIQFKNVNIYEAHIGWVSVLTKYQPPRHRN